MKDITEPQQKKLARVSKELRQERRRMGMEPDKYDRIRAHVVEGGKLGKKDSRLLEQALQVYPLLCAGKTQSEIVKIIEKAFNLSRFKALNLIRDTRRIFLFQDDFKDLGKRQILVEMTKRAYQVAEETGNANAMVRAAELIGKLEGVSDQNESYSIIFQNLTLPEITVTDDTSVIDMPIQEIEFEEG